MHPAQQAHTFASDGWFPVDLSQHIPEGQVVQSMLLGQELALWRSAAGGVQAWENRCPHRSVRLTLGFVVDDQLVCRYHGWRYGRDGRCTRVPSTPALAAPPAACVRTYMCREANGVVWVSLSLTPRAYPPRIPGLVTCRSLTLDRTFEAVTDALANAGFAPGESAVAWREVGEPNAGATVLLQPMDAHTTCVHLFVSDTSANTHRLAVARRMQALLAREFSHA